MTPIDLRALILASGLTNSEFARRVGITPRSIRRMLSGEINISPRTESAIRHMLGAADTPQTDWPRDEWIVGEGAPPNRREYIIHTTAPRFIARVVAWDELTDQCEPDEEPFDHSGIVYAASPESVIGEIVWLDPAPIDPSALQLLIDRAAEQLEWDA